MTRRASWLFVGVLWVAVLGGLALVTLPARGQAITFPLPPCVDRAKLPVPAAIAPPGLPMEWGGSCRATVSTNAAGAAALLTCPRPSGGAPLAQLYAVRWDYLYNTPGMLLDAASLAAAPTPAKAQAYQARYQVLHILDMCDVWGVADTRAKLNAAFAAAVTPAQQAAPWKVAPFGATATFPGQPTRPAFAVVGGKRGAQATTRAPGGAACDCSAPVVEGATTYCSWAAAPAGLITVCTKGTP